MAATLLAASLALGGCERFGDDRVAVHLRHAADGPGLEAVSVVAGGDDFYWSRLPASGEEQVSLHPGPDDQRELTLLFTLGEVRHDWTGPRVPSGAGYRIRLDVAASGEVAHRLCLLPCTLD